MSVDEIVTQIKRYQPFYESSGGGVTLSGGEATLYMDFCSELLQKLKTLNIHVVLETSGQFNQAHFMEKLYPYLDHIYFDIKLLDSDLHKQYCGQENTTILNNFIELQRRSSTGGVPILPRIPLIPDITATKSNLTAIASFLISTGETQVSLLPYNPMWQDKASNIGQCGDYKNTKWLTEDDIQRCHSYFKDLNITNHT